MLVGPSGCGKTTALRMVAGLEDVSEGEIRVGGRLVNDVDLSERDIAMVFQTYALYPHMTVAENIAFPLKIAKVPPEERRATGTVRLRACSGSRRSSIASLGGCRAASASAWRWDARSCASRRCS